MQPIEGITPEAIWTFLGVLVGLAALYVLYGKVRETYAKNKQMKDPGLADEISKKVMEKLEPRFQEINRKLSNDKALIEDHTQKLSAIGLRNDTMEAGQRALCRGVLALLSHEINGNSDDKLREAWTGINNYLIDK